MEEIQHESLKIEDIFAHGKSRSIDLDIISHNIENSEQNIKCFPGAVYRIENPKIVSLIFASGKVVLTSIRNKDVLDEGQILIIQKMKEAGIVCFDEPRIGVTDILSLYDIRNEINPNMVEMALTLENIEYKPEQFPGLVSRIADTKIVALLFSSGKIILTGGKNMEDIRKGLQVLEQKPVSSYDGIHQNLWVFMKLRSAFNISR